MRIFSDRPGWRHRGKLKRGLRLPRVGHSPMTSVIGGYADRPTGAVPEGPAEGVRALRAWIDSLPWVPPVPPVPLDALDRSALY